MNTFTFIMNYKDNNYYFQKHGNTILECMISLIKDLNSKMIPGLGQKSINQLDYVIHFPDQIHDFVSLEDLTNVWCMSITLDKFRYLSIFNVIKTDNLLFNGNSRFSVMLNYQGGIYFSQVHGQDIDTVIDNYLKTIEVDDIKRIKFLGTKTFIELKNKLKDNNKPQKINNFNNCWLSKIQLNYRNSIAEICIIKTAIE